MRSLNGFIFFVFLILYQVCAENRTKVDSHEMSEMSATTLPIVLQLSKSLQAETSQSSMDETSKVIEKHSNYQLISNEIEVFEDKLGPQMEKQSEDPEAETQGEEVAQSEGEAANEEEAEPDAEAAAGEEAEPLAEAAAEAEPADEPEAENAPAEPEVEEQPAEAAQLEPEPEPVAEEAAPSPDETPNAADVAADDAEAEEMPNDEPAKDDEETPASDVGEDVTKTIATKVAENQEVSCFTCTSIEDLKCHMKPTKQITCPKVNEGDAGKHNGCYTLYQTDTNTTTRGCVDELAEEGLKYCLTNDKLCSLCYQNVCNNKKAPSNAAEKQQLNIRTIFFLNIGSIIVVYFKTV